MRDYINANTDYAFKLSPTWFNDANPYYSKLIMMLNSLDVKKSDTLVNRYYANIATMQPTPSALYKYNHISFGIIDEQYKPLVEDNKIKITETNKIISVNYNYNFTLNLNGAPKLGFNNKVRIGNDSGIEFIFETNPATKPFKAILIGPKNTEAWVKAKELEYDQIIKTEEVTNTKPGSENWDVKITADGSNIIKIPAKLILKSIQGEYNIKVTHKIIKY